MLEVEWLPLKKKTKKNHQFLYIACRVIFQAFVVVCCFFFFKIKFFNKFFQEHYQSVKWFDSRSEWVLIWIQTFCKSYQQTTILPLVKKELTILNPLLHQVKTLKLTNFGLSFDCLLKTGLTVYWPLTPGCSSTPHHSTNLVINSLSCPRRRAASSTMRKWYKILYFYVYF